MIMSCTPHTSEKKSEEMSKKRMAVIFGENQQSMVYRYRGAYGKVAETSVPYGNKSDDQHSNVIPCV